MYQLVTIILYMGLTFSMWITVGPWVKEFIQNESRKIKIRSRIRKRKIDDSDKKVEDEKLSRLKLMIEMAHSNKITLEGYFFSIIAFYFMVLLFLTITGNFTIQNAIYSVVLCMLPFGVTFALFNIKRIDISYEGERLLSEFINQYRMCSGSVTEAINRTIDGLHGEKNSKRALTKLAFSLSNARDEEEIEQSVNEFNYTLNTQWGNLLSNSMLIGLKTGLDISESLDDILKEIKYIKNIIEKGNRENNESFIMIMLFAPAVYFGTTYYALDLLGMTVTKYIQLQFTTPNGFKMAVLIITAQAISMIMVLIFKRPKFD